MSKISVEDLKGLVNIITVCNRRGAFLVNELESVGILYNKISVFIDETENRGQEASKMKETEELKKLLSEDNTSSDENGGHSVTY
jgi:hypothetical protein